MYSDLNAMKERFLAKLREIVKIPDVENLRIEYLGKKGLVADLMSELRSVPAEEKKEAGQKINEIKQFIEKTITEKVNTAHIGPLGLGGKHSVLATFAKIGPQRASGVRIVALRSCCCFEPRRACVEL